MTRPARLVLGAVLVGLGLGVLVAANGIPVRPVRGDPGPRAVPVASAVLVTAGAAWATFGDLHRSRPPSMVSASGATAVACAGVLYLVALPRVGFLASTALFMGGVSLLLDRPRRYPVTVHLATAIATAALLWAIFARIFGVILPRGPLGV